MLGAEGSGGGSPRRGALANTVRGKGSAVSGNQLAAQYQTLSPEEQTAFRASAGLPPPTGRTVNAIWLLVIGGLILIGVVALVLAYLLTNNDKTADAAWAVVTATVAGIAAILVPSPVGNT